MQQVSKDGWSQAAESYVAPEGARQTDRYTMQSEVRYLLGGLWRGREKGRRAQKKREREREAGEGEKWREAEAAFSRGRQKERRERD